MLKTWSTPRLEHLDRRALAGEIAGALTELRLRDSSKATTLELLEPHRRRVEKWHGLDEGLEVIDWPREAQAELVERLDARGRRRSSRSAS